MNPIRIDPEILGGTPCFAGTRVPITNLFDYLEEGSSINDFFEDFPTVSPQQVQAILELAKAKLVADAA